MKMKKQFKVITIVAFMILIMVMLIFGIFLSERAEKIHNNTYTEETKTFLGYLLTKGDKTYIIRCEKDVKQRFIDYSLNYELVRVVINLNSSKDDLPSVAEGNKLSKIEQSFLNKTIKENELGLAGYVTGGGKKEIFLYTNNDQKLLNIFSNLEKEFSDHKMGLVITKDANWDYYNSYCEKRNFPN